MSPQAAAKLGAYLRETREEQGLSQRAVAKRGDLDHVTVARLEQGLFLNPRPETLKTLADVLGLNLSDLFTMAGYVQPQGLPNFAPYLRTKYGEMPDEAVAELDAHFQKIAKKHGFTSDTYRGPLPGEDEH
jgi:transcriptional regulator with XRE-family HTH domain